MSVLFEHQLDTGRRIDFDNREQIASIQHHKTRLIREAIEIERMSISIKEMLHKIS